MSYGLTVLKIDKDPLLHAFFQWQATGEEEDFLQFLSRLYDNGAQDDFSSYVEEKILCDQNAFSIAAAKQKGVSPYLEKAYRQDLALVREKLVGAKTQDMFCIGEKLTEKKESADSIAALETFYRRFGYGEFIRYRAFRFEDGNLRPVESPSLIQLSDLKNYESEKKTVADNIENFLHGYPHSNMLLYGERGTGKSSTIHAMLNRYFDEGLRLVEISKENVLCVAALKERLKDVPLKFMIYIDDLSFSSGDERISSLKAALEGCSEGNTENAMIVATSNRRHIIDESFSRRDDSVHAGDNMQEELSLSDRFGITVLFSTTNKEAYLSIVRQMADDKKIDLSREQLELLAERWAIMKGGRSPRRARQFIDLVYSRMLSKTPIDF